MLVDGGFAQLEDIEKVSSPEVGVRVYAPVQKPRKEGRDPHQPLPGDSVAIAAGRQRMGTPEAKEIYQERASTAEWVNAISRNRGLRQFLVRGLQKVRTVVLWFALAHNLLRAVALRAQAAVATVGDGKRGLPRVNRAPGDRLEKPKPVSPQSVPGCPERKGTVFFGRSVPRQGSDETVG